MHKKYILSIFSVVAALLILFLAGISFGQPGEADAQVGSGVGNYDIAGNVVVHGNVKVADGYDLTLTDDLVATGGASFSDDLTASADLITEGEVGNTAETTVTVTAGGTVTPLGRWVPLSAAGNVGTSSIAGCAAGDSYSEDIVLINMSSNTITFTDTGTLKLAGNLALGQYDSAILKCDNLHGNWILVSTSNN